MELVFPRPVSSGKFWSGIKEGWNWQAGMSGVGVTRRTEAEVTPWSLKRMPIQRWGGVGFWRTGQTALVSRVRAWLHVTMLVWRKDVLWAFSTNGAVFKTRIFMLRGMHRQEVLRYKSFMELYLNFYTSLLPFKWKGSFWKFQYAKKNFCESCVNSCLNLATFLIHHCLW